MASAPGHRFRLNSAALTSMFLPGGDVWAFGRTVGLEALSMSIATAPGRTQMLRNSHGMTQTPNGKQRCRTTIHNDADYALFVHEGTVGPIRSTRPGGLLLIRAAPHSRYAKPTLRSEVAGQSANPWMRDAMEHALARHGIR